MASITMAASFAGCSATTIERPSAARKLAVVRAARAENKKEVGNSVKFVEEGDRSGRRAAMFAAASIAVSAIASVPVFAEEEEPKRGTPEAKAKYAPVCVTMPTARICHK